MPLVLLWFLFGDLHIFLSRLCFDGFHWSGFVHDWVILPDLPNLFVRGNVKNLIFGRSSLPFPSVALRIDFSTAARQGSGLVCEVFRVPDLRYALLLYFCYSQLAVAEFCFDRLG